MTGDEKCTTFSHPKNYYSCKKCHVPCLVKLERNPVFWPFTEQQDNRSREALFPIRQIENQRLLMISIRQLKSKIEQKRPESVNCKGVVFHQYPQPRVSLITRQVVGNPLRYSSPQEYLQDLAPYGFHQFRSLENSFNEKNFSCLVEI